MLESNGGIPTRIDKRVLQFIAIRDEIAAIKARHKEELAPYEETKQKLIDEMLAFLDKTGQTSARTEYGLATIQDKSTAICSDPDLFVHFVRENDAYELMDRRANLTACRDYAQANDGMLPPGVKINSWRTVGVTKS
jgi:hypothetical protein